MDLWTRPVVAKGICGHLEQQFTSFQQTQPYFVLFRDSEVCYTLGISGLLLYSSAALHVYTRGISLCQQDFVVKGPGACWCLSLLSEHLCLWLASVVAEIASVVFRYVH